MNRDTPILKAHIAVRFAAEKTGKVWSSALVSFKGIINFFIYGCQENKANAQFEQILERVWSTLIKCGIASSDSSFIFDGFRDLPEACDAANL